VANRGRHEVVAADADDGEIGVRVVTDQIGRKAPAVQQRRLYSIAVRHHVTVRENQPVLGEHEPGSGAAASHFDVDDGR
jgi:hypothetical protein